MRHATEPVEAKMLLLEPPSSLTLDLDESFRSNVSDTFMSKLGAVESSKDLRKSVLVTNLMGQKYKLANSAPPNTV